LIKNLKDSLQLNLYAGVWRCAFFLLLLRNINVLRRRQYSIMKKQTCST